MGITIHEFLYSIFKKYFTISSEIIVTETAIHREIKVVNLKNI